MQSCAFFILLLANFPFLYSLKLREKSALTPNEETSIMLRRPRCEVCANCRESRRSSRRPKVCMYQLDNLQPLDLKSSMLLKMLRRDRRAQEATCNELESQWIAPPASPVKRPRDECRTESSLVGDDPERVTSLHAALAALNVRAAITIQRHYTSYQRREKFRAWVRLAMNTDAGRNKLATMIASNFWRRIACMREYHHARRAVIALQNFSRIVRARKIAMSKALALLRIRLNEVLGQTWRLHRTVTAIEKSGRKKDRKRVRLATEYLVSQGHGQSMSVPGVLRLCRELESTKKSVASIRRKKIKRWNKQRPPSWEAALSSSSSEKRGETGGTMLPPTSPVSRWFGRQRRVRERKSSAEVARRMDREHVLERRRKQKERDGEERERWRMEKEERLSRVLVEEEADASFPWPTQ